MEAVARILRVNRTLKKLDLSRNQLVGVICVRGGPEGLFSLSGLEQLAAALKVNSSLTHLDLSQNYLGGYRGEEDSTFDDAYSILAGAVRDSGTLRVLNVTCNNFSVTNAKKLSKLLETLTPSTSLVSLYGLGPGQTSADLSSRGLLEGDAININFELKNQSLLTALDLSFNQFFGGRGIMRLYDSLASIKSKHPLSKLILKGISTECDEDVCLGIANIIRLALGSLIVIKEFDLSGNRGLFGGDEERKVFLHITEAVEAVPALKYLNVSHCGITSNTSGCLNFCNVREYTFCSDLVILPRIPRFFLPF